MLSIPTNQLHHVYICDTGLHFQNSKTLRRAGTNELNNVLLCYKFNTPTQVYTLMSNEIIS